MIFIDEYYDSLSAGRDAETSHVYVPEFEGVEIRPVFTTGFENYCFFMGVEDDMSCYFICDGCGKREKADKSANGGHIKPRLWYQRSDKDGTQDACCRECIEKIAAQSKKTSVVLPW